MEGFDKDLIIWAAINRQLVKSRTFHDPEQNRRFHEIVHRVRIRLREGFLGVDEALKGKEKRRFKYE